MKRYSLISCNIMILCFIIASNSFGAVYVNEGITSLQGWNCEYEPNSSTLLPVDKINFGRLFNISTYTQIAGYDLAVASNGDIVVALLDLDGILTLQSYDSTTEQPSATFRATDSGYTGSNAIGLDYDEQWNEYVVALPDPQTDKIYLKSWNNDGSPGLLDFQFGYNGNPIENMNSITGMDVAFVPDGTNGSLVVAYAGDYWMHVIKYYRDSNGYVSDVGAVKQDFYITNVMPTVIAKPAGLGFDYIGYDPNTGQQFLCAFLPEKADSDLSGVRDIVYFRILGLFSNVSPTMTNAGWDWTNVSADKGMGIATGDFGVNLLDVIDSKIALFTIGEKGLKVDEQGATSETYKIVPLDEPVANVVIDLSWDASQIGVDTTRLTFTPANYNASQMLTVTAIDDTVAEDPQLVGITHSVSSSDATYDGISFDLKVEVIDNDAACGLPGTVSYDGDINKDCYVNLDDFVFLAEEWLEISNDCAFLSDIWQDCNVDMLDLRKFMLEWLGCTDPGKPNECVQEFL